MLKPTLYFWILLLITSCEKRESEYKKESKINNSDKSINHLDSIRFDFSANRNNNLNEFVNIKINATIFNDKSDTVYFLTTTCYGEIYSLRYDTAKFDLISLINCNASNPIVQKIAPKGKFNFQADFRDETKEDSIKLGFDFYSVDKSFQITRENWNYLNIFDRPSNEQTIIWANERINK